MFMEIAIGAIGIGVVLMVGYLVISQVRTALPTPHETYNNSCYRAPNTTDVTYCNPATTASGTTPWVVIQSQVTQRQQLVVTA